MDNLPLTRNTYIIISNLVYFLIIGSPLPQLRHRGVALNPAQLLMNLPSAADMQDDIEDDEDDTNPGLSLRPLTHEGLCFCFDASSHIFSIFFFQRKCSFCVQCLFFVIVIFITPELQEKSVQSYASSTESPREKGHSRAHSHRNTLKI
jgi:hypothetical protein